MLLLLLMVLFFANQRLVQDGVARHRLVLSDVGDFRKRDAGQKQTAVEIRAGRAGDGNRVPQCPAVAFGKAVSASRRYSEFCAARGRCGLDSGGEAFSSR
jgi:hypothetical protein